MILEAQSKKTNNSGLAVTNPKAGMTGSAGGDHSQE